MQLRVRQFIFRDHVDDRPKRSATRYRRVFGTRSGHKGERRALGRSRRPGFVFAPYEDTIISTFSVLGAAGKDQTRALEEGARSGAKRAEVCGAGFPRSDRPCIDARAICSKDEGIERVENIGKYHLPVFSFLGTYTDSPGSGPFVRGRQ